MNFNVLDFGAVGDGKTDCTKAIQAALDAASECGGKVYVPSGKYLTGELTMRGEGIRLEGDSAWSFRNDGASVLILNDDSAKCLLNVTGAFGGAVCGICMNGGGQGENIHGMYLYWDEYNGGGQEDSLTVDDCRIGNFTGDGLHFEHVWCFSVRHSMIHGNVGCGLFIDGWDAFILDNWFTFNKNGGMNGKLIGALTCTGNRVEWNDVGGFVLPDGNSINITGNFFDRTFGPAIILGSKEKRFDLATITGNVIRRSGAYNEGDYFDDDRQDSHVRIINCSRTVISGNVMRTGVNDDQNGPETPKYGIVIDKCIDTVIESNIMKYSATESSLMIENELPNSVVFGTNIGM